MTENKNFNTLSSSIFFSNILIPNKKIFNKKIGNPMSTPNLISRFFH